MGLSEVPRKKKAAWSLKAVFISFWPSIFGLQDLQPR
jgi:hypothetical protein